MVGREFRVIPGYEGYCVNQNGLIKSIERDIFLRRYVLNGYLIVDTFRGSLTETLPVHRAVALAWVVNPDPDNLDVVNHLDGEPTNNRWTNLEWTDCSGNNYHAVNTGLRSDNIECRVRDFYTREVKLFSSMAQAAEFMGLAKTSGLCMLYPKMFGKLISKRYEFRFVDDPAPWFYENRIEMINPSRYMVVVYDLDGSSKEIYSNRTMLQDYQLYDSPGGKSMPELAAYANIKFPDKKFVLRDSYVEPQYRERRKTEPSTRQPIRAIDIGENVMCFPSLTKCASYFKVDRSSISNRLTNGQDLNGWTFTPQPLQSVMVERNLLELLETP